jgi:Right handed beta helix region
VCVHVLISTPQQCDISYNTASEAGGIEGYQYSNITIYSSTFTHNEGTGAALLTTGNLSMYDSFVTDNHGDGGILIDKRFDEALSTRLVTIQSTVFLDNSAEVGAAMIIEAEITVYVNKVSVLLKFISCMLNIHTITSMVTRMLADHTSSTSM